MDIAIIPVGMLGTNCYLLQSEKKSCAIIDPGAQGKKILDIIEKEGLTPRMILLTHGHHDHIGAVKEIAKKCTDIKVYIGADDLELIEDATKNRAAMHFQQTDDYIIKGAETLKDGQELTVDELTIRVVTTPGHTRGGVAYLCRDVMFSGDTLFAGECGRCDLYGGDYEVMKKSLKKLAELEGDYEVYPGHGDSSTLEKERKTNRYMLDACL